MRRSFITALTVGALAIMGLVIAPTAEAAIPAHCSAVFTVSSAQYGEDSQTVSLATTPRKVLFGVTFVVPAGEFNDCPAVTRWELMAGDDVNGGGDRNLYVHVGSDSPNATIDPARLENTDAGDDFEVSFRYRADGSWFYNNTDLLVVKRATKWSSTNGSPEPTIKGNHILVRATLTRANWETLTFAPYAGRSVRYQNRDADGGPYVNRGSSVLTNNAGYASKSVKADISRVHRFVYAGNSIAGASTAYGDYVAVTDN